jgi:hypothetical protein
MHAVSVRQVGGAPVTAVAQRTHTSTESISLQIGRYITVFNAAKSKRE